MMLFLIGVACGAVLVMGIAFVWIVKTAEHLHFYF